MNGKRTRRPVKRRRAPTEVPRTLTTMADGRVQTWRSPGTSYTFVRAVPPAALTKAASDQGYGINFTLTSLAGASEFTNLFDQYRVNWLEMSFTWDPGASVVNLPSLYISQDWDGIAGAPTLNSISECSGMKLVMFDATHRTFNCRIVRPGVVLASATSSSGRVVRSPWLDAANTSEPHYGLLVWASAYNSSAASGTLVYQYRASISFRTVR